MDLGRRGRAGCRALRRTPSRPPAARSRALSRVTVLQLSGRRSSSGRAPRRVPRSALDAWDRGVAMAEDAPRSCPGVERMASSRAGFSTCGQRRPGADITSDPARSGASARPRTSGVRRSCGNSIAITPWCDGNGSGLLDVSPGGYRGATPLACSRGRSGTLGRGVHDALALRSTLSRRYSIAAGEPRQGVGLSPLAPELPGLCR